MSRNKKWAADDVRAILINPITTGIPPFPQLMSDDDWISAQERRIDRDREDVRQYFTDMLSWLRKSFDGVKDSPACIDPSRITDDEWVAAHVESVKQHGTRKAMQMLLQELRTETDHA